MVIRLCNFTAYNRLINTQYHLYCQYQVYVLFVSEAANRDRRYDMFVDFSQVLHFQIFDHLIEM